MSKWIKHANSKIPAVMGVREEYADFGEPEKEHVPTNEKKQRMCEVEGKSCGKIASREMVLEKKETFGTGGRKPGNHSGKKRA